MKKGFVRKLWKISAETQRAALKASGLTDRDIYDHDEGAENIWECLKAFRGRGGDLVISADMRVFGLNQEDITKVVDRCELERINIVDLAHPELKTISRQQKYAFTRLAAHARWGGDRKRAQRTGAQGGRIRGQIAALKRAEKMPEDAIRALLKMIGETLTWRDAARITGLSTATLRRHYWERK